MDVPIEFCSIGIIHTPFTNKSGIPIQSIFGEKFTGTIEIYPQFLEGLEDLDGFSHIHLLYHFNQHSDYALKVKPYMDETYRGVFATRAPKRPNGIGLSLVELLKIEENIIHFKGVDIIDQTPLLDIKPYCTEIDMRENVRCGWLDQVKKKNTISDNRF